MFWFRWMELMRVCGPSPLEFELPGPARRALRRLRQNPRFLANASKYMDL
ncbi:MAG: hypothetical protein AB1641_29640 [Thermodesulfobacteriota bacterium]